MKLLQLLSLIFLISFFSGCSTKNDSKINNFQPKKVVTVPQKGKLAGFKIIHAFGCTKLNKNDKEYIIRTSQQALDNAKTGEVIQWRNPDSGSRGTIKLLSDNHTEGDNTCRKYYQSAVIEGKELKSSGKACHQQGSSWLDSF